MSVHRGQIAGEEAGNGNVSEDRDRPRGLPAAC